MFDHVGCEIFGGLLDELDPVADEGDSLALLLGHFDDADRDYRFSTACGQICDEALLSRCERIAAAGDQFVLIGIKVQSLDWFSGCL